MARTSSSPTRARHVREALREELLSGGLAGGERLPTTPLSERFGVSTAVVREALTALAAEGLVVAEPQAGFRVVDLSIERLLDITAVRTEIEGLALRRAIRDGDLAWESAAVAAHHTLAATPAREGRGAVRSAAWSAAHKDFHRCLVAGCGSPALLEIRDRLWDATQMYRSLSVFAGDAGDRDDSAEHRELLDAVLARRADRAVELITAHISRTAELVLGAEASPRTRRR